MKKLIDEGYNEVSENIGQLKMVSPDGKQRLTDCANTETMFRMIQGGYGYTLYIYKNNIQVYKCGGYGSTHIAEYDARRYFLDEEFDIEPTEN